MIHEKMFENRLFFTDKLRDDGRGDHDLRSRIARSSSARGGCAAARVESPDIRAGMAMLIAALCADGVTEIGNVRQIDRGYERIDERLRELGRADHPARRRSRHRVTRSTARLATT